MFFISYSYDIYFLEKIGVSNNTALSMQDMLIRLSFSFFRVIRKRGMKTRLFSFGGIGYRVSLNSTYFDIYLFTRLIPRAFNQPTITVGSEQRNVFKNIRWPDRFVRSPFEVTECRWPPRKFSREVKISVVMCIRTDMSMVQNYSISRKVSSDTFISRSLKGLSYGRLYGTATPRIPKREVKIMRGTAL